jgi:transposase
MNSVTYDGTGMLGALPASAANVGYRALRGFTGCKWTIRRLPHRRKLVGEACGPADQWARTLTGPGNGVKRIETEAVKPFAKKSKKNAATDGADAAAICAVASRPDTKFVPAKSLAQQGMHEAPRRTIRRNSRKPA